MALLKTENVAPIMFQLIGQKNPRALLEVAQPRSQSVLRQPFEAKGVSRFEVTTCDFKRGGARVKMPLKAENIAGLLHWIRGEKVLLSQDLATLYGVTAGALNQAVKRNRDRFPADFMFQLSQRDFENLKSQIVISSHGGLRRALPYAFTEQGVAMLSTVLRSPRAVEVNIAIMRTFVQLRRLMDSNRQLARKIEAMEKHYDEQFAVVFDAIKRLIAEDDARKSSPKGRIGFVS